ncbi:MAG: hypothetical protein LBQ06_05045 [Frankiaceae bacterium]|nr:hypothetical protein [Frankiaceae bacterium]
MTIPRSSLGPVQLVHQGLRRTHGLGVLVAIATVLAAVEAVAVLLIGSGPTGAGTSGADVPMALPPTLAARAPALDPDAALSAVNSARTDAAAGALQASSCLNRAAASMVAAVGAGVQPDSLSLPAVCGEPVQWASAQRGWISGADSTGAAQLGGALGGAAAGGSALLDPAQRWLGLALGKRTDRAGQVIGFVLVWVVSR